MSKIAHDLQLDTTSHDPIIQKVTPGHFYKFEADKTAKEEQVRQYMNKPGIEAAVIPLAATLNDTFNATTKLLIDIRPGAEFSDDFTKTKWVYEGSISPFEFDVPTTAILRIAKHPNEDLKDIAYAVIRHKALNGRKVMLSLRDFAKLVAIKRFVVDDFGISDENEITKDLRF